MDQNKNVLAFVEVVDGKPVNVGLESLTAARTLVEGTDEKVVAVLIGSGLDDAAAKVAASGVDKVVVVDNAAYAAFALDAFTNVLEQLIKKCNPAYVLAGNTPLTKGLLPSLAAAFKSGNVADVMSIKKDGGKIAWATPRFGGTVIASEVIEKSPIQFATIRPGAFEKPATAAKAASIEKESIAVAADALRTKILEAVKEMTEDVNIEDADIIVTGGRGMGTPENFKLVEKLAEVLGGVVGATRPAIEENWAPRSRQVGQSGKIVTPKLYIACGVSGATQHVSGMSSSKYIVAINKDEEAPIFNVANVGIVGDAMKILPVMIEELKKVKAEA
ncbi:MAG TPA: electron transfer flavoprotein subunit alpha/FixB family protein [Ruminococcaceae bacterium]|nr:electron transfer flavoprotein subunit alpha/FixB family protein [Oscillospiraceae bacterium]